MTDEEEALPALPMQKGDPDWSKPETSANGDAAETGPQWAQTLPTSPGAEAPEAGAAEEVEVAEPPVEEPTLQGTADSTPPPKAEVTAEPQVAPVSESETEAGAGSENEPPAEAPVTAPPRAVAAVAGRAAQPAGAGFPRPAGPASTTDVGADWCRGAGDTCAQCRLGAARTGPGLGAEGAAGGGARHADVVLAQGGDSAHHRPAGPPTRAGSKTHATSADCWWPAARRPGPGHAADDTRPACASEVHMGGRGAEVQVRAASESGSRPDRRGPVLRRVVRVSQTGWCSGKRLPRCRAGGLQGPLFGQGRVHRCAVGDGRHEPPA